MFSNSTQNIPKEQCFIFSEPSPMEKILGTACSEHLRLEEIYKCKGSILNPYFVLQHWFLCAATLYEFFWSCSLYFDLVADLVEHLEIM